MSCVTCLGHNGDSKKMFQKCTTPRRPGLTEKSGVLITHAEAGASENAFLSIFAAEKTRERQNRSGSCPQRPNEVNWRPDASLFVLCCAISYEVPVELISLFKALTLY